MRKRVSGWIGIVMGLAGFANLLQPGRNGPHDALSVLMPALFLFLGVYYLVSARRDKLREQPNKWAP